MNNFLLNVIFKKINLKYDNILQLFKSQKFKNQDSQLHGCHETVFPKI